jgi:hypothetical protein
MLGDPEFETMRELNGDTDGTVIGNGFHGGEIAHLGNIPAKGEFRFKEKENVAAESPAERLDFYVATKEVASVGRATRIDSASIRRLGKGATSQVWLVVGRRDLKIRIAADPIVWKEESRLCDRRNLPSNKGILLRLRKRKKKKERDSQDERDLHEAKSPLCVQSRRKSEPMRAEETCLVHAPRLRNGPREATADRAGSFGETHKCCGVYIKGRRLEKKIAVFCGRITGIV